MDTPGIGRAAGLVGGVTAAGLAAFQAALALGAPWGEGAWGGGQAEPGAGLRAASAVAAGIWVGAAATVARRGGLRTWAPVPDRWLGRATGIVAGYAGLGTLLNLISRSDLERAVMTPVALLIAVAFGTAARWGTGTAAVTTDPREPLAAAR